MDEVEQNSLNPIFFLHNSCYIKRSVLSWRSTTFLLLKSAGHFFRFSWIHCKCWEYKSALSVWLQFNNSKWIPVLPLGKQHNFSSMKLYLSGGQQRFICVNPLFFFFCLFVFVEFFCLHKHCYKRHFHNLLWYSWEISHFFALKEDLMLWNCDLPYSSKSMRNPNTQLAHFSYVFHVAADCGLEGVEAKC